MDYKYCAGMIDADGCFGIHPKKKGEDSYSIRVYCKIDQKLKEYLLRDIAEEYNVSLYEQSNGVGRVTLCGEDALDFATKIRDYLLIKGPVCDYIMSLKGLTVSKEELVQIRSDIKKLREDEMLHSFNLTDEYIAGFIDGDGWLASTFNPKTGQLQFKICALSHKSQAHALKLIKQKLGGSFYYRKNGDHVGYTLYLTIKNLHCLESIGSNLRQKKERFNFMKEVVSKGLHLKRNGATAESNREIYEDFKSISLGGQDE